MPINEKPIPFYSADSVELIDNVVLIDKPRDITSFDVVRQLRRFSGIKKIGHAGTLDPIATGLLICMVGSTTKLSRHFMDLPKVYSGKFKIGQETASYDSETPVIKTLSTSHVTRDVVRQAVAPLLGDIIQVTPIYAAVKVGGKPLYAYARAGEKVTRPPRVVSVYKFETELLDDDLVSFEIHCSTGTYVRTLVHDLGQAIDAGAHLVELRRESIGEHHVKDAVDWSHFTAEANS